MTMILFSYQIVPSGGSKEHALARGTLYIADVQKAKRYVQTVAAPNLAADASDLEVILLDHMGSQIWRGPYLGPPH